MTEIVKMRDVRFDPGLFVNFSSGTVLDNLLCSYQGLPKGVNYMIIGDPGVGKTTIILDLIANIDRHNTGTRILFISAEMNEIDLAVYVQRYPKFGDLNIMFVESDFDGHRHHLQEIEDVLQGGWDIVAIDSFYELQGIVKEEEDITMRLAETKLLALIKRHNKAINDTHTNTTFLTIQQVTKSGAFIGSNRLRYGFSMELYSTDYQFTNSYGVPARQNENTNNLSAYMTYKVTAGKWLIDPGRAMSPLTSNATARICSCATCKATYRPNCVTLPPNLNVCLTMK